MPDKDYQPDWACRWRGHCPSGMLAKTFERHLSSQALLHHLFILLRQFPSLLKGPHQGSLPSLIQTQPSVTISIFPYLFPYLANHRSKHLPSSPKETYLPCSIRSVNYSIPTRPAKASTFHLQGTYFLLRRTEMQEKLR